MFAIETKYAELPFPGQRFPLVHGVVGAAPLGENIIIAADWAKFGVAPLGTKRAYALTLDEGTVLDCPLYVTLILTCADGDDRWVVLHEQAFHDIFNATQHYGLICRDEHSLS